MYDRFFHRDSDGTEAMTFSVPGVGEEPRYVVAAEAEEVEGSAPMKTWFAEGVYYTDDIDEIERAIGEIPEIEPGQCVRVSSVFTRLDDIAEGKS